MFRFQLNKINLDTALKVSEYQQQIRNFRFRKPPWVPRSKKAQFRVPPARVQNLEEQTYMKPIWNEYKANMRSIYQLFKTEAKFSDKESLLAQEERRVIREKELSVLKKNDEINDKILKQQLQDEDVKLKIKIAEAEKKLNEKNIIEELYRQEANEKVKILKEKAKNFIDPNKLEYEIEKILNERVDYNFSVDSSGRFWRNKVLINHENIFDPKFIPIPKNEEIMQSKEPLENLSSKNSNTVQNDVKNTE